MSRVKSAIAMSDIHLGIPDCYLHSKNSTYEKNAEQLLATLNELGPRDELIINGDFLDLVLAGHDAVYEDVRAFFALIAEAGPYKRIIYIPGNHDHHFWTSLVEFMNVNGSLRRGETPPNNLFYPYCFVDARFSSEDPTLAYDIPLTNCWPKNKPRPEIVVKYPHHLVIVQGREEERNYLFTHGHFLEPLFKPVNFLIEPAQLEELEAFNNFWLEAFNYHIGHAGKLTSSVFTILESYEKGGKQETRKLRSILESGGQLFTNLFRLKWHKAIMLRIILKAIARKLTFEGKAQLFEVPINDNLKYNIAHYIHKYILLRYRQGKTGTYHIPMDTDIPTPFTFVFGHTHRPVTNADMRDTMVFVNGYEYPILNTGGWLKRAGARDLNGKSSGILVMDQEGARWISMEGKLS
ncbi:metallophosphoesterase [bacterium]|nr:metallophosphoesterase [bacterium]